MESYPHFRGDVPCIYGYVEKVPVCVYTLTGSICDITRPLLSDSADTGQPLPGSVSYLPSDISYVSNFLCPSGVLLDAESSFLYSPNFNLTTV